MKLGLLVQYDKLECLVKKLDYCIQVHGHSGGSKYWWLFLLMIASELPSIALPNLVWQYIIKSWSVIWKDWFAFFKVKVTNTTTTTLILTLSIHSDFRLKRRSYHNGFVVLFVEIESEMTKRPRPRSFQSASTFKLTGRWKLKWLGTRPHQFFLSKCRRPNCKTEWSWSCGLH